MTTADRSIATADLRVIEAILRRDDAVEDTKPTSPSAPLCRGLRGVPGLVLADVVADG